MERYIHEENIALYLKVLSETTDPTKRQTVLKLLAEERAAGGDAVSTPTTLTSIQ
jgi:hypothetical protein